MGEAQGAFADFCGRMPRLVDAEGNGGMGIRTPDIQLAKLALYQLSYTPKCAANLRRNARSATPKLHIAF